MKDVGYDSRTLHLLAASLMPIFDHFLIMFDHYIPSFSFVMVCQGLGMISVYVWWAGAAAEKPTSEATGAFTGVGGSGIMSSLDGRPKQF